MKRLSKEIIDDIARTTKIPPSYLEKDWYLVLTLNLLQSLNTGEAQIVFSGGSSLAKAYNLVSRFSDDIDFMVNGVENLNRNNRSKLKHNIIDKINENGMVNINSETIKAKDANRFFKFYIDYPSCYDTQDTLRKGIKTEISIKPTYLEPVNQEVTTFLGQYVEDAPKAVIPCVSLVETAANKFCGLMWRLAEEHKKFLETGESKNRNLMRHLHDLSALYPVIMDNCDTFISLIDTIYQIDVKRGDKQRNIDLVDFIEQTYTIIRSNKIYHQNYDSFVENMYFTQDNVIGFDEAFDNYESICNFVIEQKQGSNPSM